MEAKKDGTYVICIRDSIRNNDIEGVEQNHRGGVGVGDGQEVAERVRRQRRSGFEPGHILGAHGVMFFEVREALQVAFFLYGEVGGGEAGDRPAVAIGHHNVEQDLADGDGDGWGLRAAGLRSLRSLCRRILGQGRMCE